MTFEKNNSSLQREHAEKNEFKKKSGQSNIRNLT